MKKRELLFYLIVVIFALLLFYFLLPPLNITSFTFWSYLLTIVIFYVVFSSIFNFDINNKGIGLSKKSYTIIKRLGLCVAFTFAVIMCVNIIFSPVFNSKKYSERINVKEDGDFTSDIALVDFNKLPLLDKDSSQKIGDRVMGQLPELVSQFDVSNLYTQINYNDQIIRVTPLEYNGLIKYFTNREDGVKGYITVNSVDGEAKLTKLDKGMKYMPSAYFFENLDRKLRFSYPTEIFGEKSFEIDNEGNPYWIIPTIKYTGVNLKEQISGIIIFDPTNGKSQKYDLKDVPTWVDHVYSAHLIIEQLNDWGKYRDGYFNSIFGQKNVVATTSGYNYTVMNDDVYLYTGITSVVSDEANIGFILTNMRTKETAFYPVPGAEEYSAMASAKGQVQQMNYTPTFPLLINLNNRPTYLISLKDNAGLVKMYSFVDVADYQKVVVTDASKGIETAAKNYLGTDINFGDKETLTKNIVIKKIATGIIDGNTYYYITDTSNKKYKVSIKTNESILPFIRVDDEIKITYIDNDNISDISKVEL